jgi:carboxymethylenebutenolidase
MSELSDFVSVHANMLTRLPDLAAASFYGNQPSPKMSQISAPLLIHLWKIDERINAGWPAYEAASKLIT